MLRLHTSIVSFVNGCDVSDTQCLSSCSIECYQQHQSTDCKAIIRNEMGALPRDILPKAQPIFQSIVPDHSQHSHQLTTFQMSIDLQRLFLNFPRLRALLKEVYAVTNEPLDNSDKEMSRGTYRMGQGSHRGCRVNKTQQNRTSAPWSQRKGFMLGLQRLRKFQETGGLKSEGLNEFSKLVLNPAK